VRKGFEAVQKSLKEQKHFTQRRKVQEGAKKRKQLLFASLCALASLREIVYFFTASEAFRKTERQSRAQHWRELPFWTDQVSVRQNSLRIQVWRS
jgi:ABC-type multidrug transport system permease subunit